MKWNLGATGMPNRHVCVTTKCDKTAAFVYTQDNYDTDSETNLNFMNW
jgi:hypothetical protein